MGGRKAVLAVLLGVLLLVLAACESSTVPSIDGVVTDSRTGKPLDSVTVTIADESATTDGDGRFVIREVPKDAKVVLERCGYEPESGSLDANNPDGDLSMTMTPTETSAQVISNLTNKGMPAVVKAGGDSKKTNENGVITLHGLCDTEKITASAAGYEKATVSATQEGARAIQLQAGPGETLQQMRRWESEQQWNSQWALVHPDAFAYISKAEWVRVAKESVAAGYQGIREVIKSVDVITWTFPACQFDEFGPKTYKNTAAVSAIRYESSPSGGQTRTQHLSHLVRTKDGLWKWFPVAGCDTEP